MLSNCMNLFQPPAVASTVNPSRTPLQSGTTIYRCSMPSTSYRALPRSFFSVLPNIYWQAPSDIGPEPELIVHATSSGHARCAQAHSSPKRSTQLFFGAECARSSAHAWNSRYAQWVQDAPDPKHMPRVVGTHTGHQSRQLVPKRFAITALGGPHRSHHIYILGKEISS